MLLKMHVVTGESVPSAAVEQLSKYRFSSASTPTFPQPLHPNFLSLYTHLSSASTPTLSFYLHPQPLHLSLEPLHPSLVSTCTSSFSLYAHLQPLHSASPILSLCNPSTASNPSSYTQPLSYSLCFFSSRNLFRVFR